MNADSINRYNISRREFIQTCALGAAALASGSILGCSTSKPGSASTRGPASFSFPLDQDWWFGGKINPDAPTPALPDTTFSKITLPHCVTNLSWQNWQPDSWENVWIYRRHFTLPEASANRRVFITFDGVMTSATPAINGTPLPKHQGGYLPFRYELTRWLKEGDNVLDVVVDSRWQNVPPDGSPRGPRAVDYLEPGGIFRSVRLDVVPASFISDVFAKPVNALTPDRRVEVACTIDTAFTLGKPAHLEVKLLDGSRVVARKKQALTLDQAGENSLTLTLSNLGDISLWDLDAPKLYDVVTTLFVGGRPLHDHRTRIGFREARFTVDGFFLNGQRRQLFGLNRHEIYPYTGGAMPPRVLRRDAEILRRDFNCNIVRCSHYPQSEAFLDACDELGLMVWEETPGWGYLGDDAWKEIVVQNVTDMIRRDRNHAAIVIWGVRVNESKNDQPLYQRTTEIAKSLDGSRPTSGSMTGGSRKNWQQEWHEDVFAFDDYHSAPDGSVGIEKPVGGVPYMLAEAVGQFSYGNKGFNNQYRRAGAVALQTAQALYHAQAHNKAAADPGNSGVIAWCAFDYASLLNAYHAVKCPGVADVFRLPKPGAAFYLAQVSPQVRSVIAPDFYWDFGTATPRGPGKNAAIFSNCDRLQVFLAGKLLATLQPDREHFEHLQYPPFFCDLDIDAAGQPELRIDGYVGDRLMLSRSFSADPTRDQFWVSVDDLELNSDGADATRVIFKVADEFGAERLFADGEVTFEIEGPGVLVGDNPFSLAESGGVGAVWIKTLPGNPGRITLKAIHSTLGAKTIAIDALPTNHPPV